MFDAALAERCCRQILSIDPNHVHRLHMLGLSAQNQGHPEIAISHIRQAILINARIPEFRRPAISASSAAVD